MATAGADAELGYEVVLGLDAGTTSARAVAVDRAEHVLAAAGSDPIATRSTADGGSEQDPADIWLALTTAGRRAVESLASDIRVAALAVAAQSGSVIPMPVRGRAERAIRVTSASVTLARDVAETTLGLMIVGRKRIWPLGNHVRDGGWRDSPVWDRWDARELNRSTVGLIGAGSVGRHVIDLLGPFETTTLVADTYLSADEAQRLGVEKVEPAELMDRCDVVSIHAPDNEQTRHMIGAGLLGRLRDGAVLINTARGSIIDEPALIDELATGRIFAFLDVTDPEPPAPDSPLRRLDNVVVTPHIAGCIENCHRMGELAVEEVCRYLAGQPAINVIRRDMLDRIA